KGLHLGLALAHVFRAESDGVARHDHARESHGEPSQAVRPPGSLTGHRGGDAHLEHAVRDQAWKSNRARELVVQVDRIHVAGRLRVGGDLLPGEGDLSFGHKRITNNARERQTGEPCSSLVSVSNETNRMPRRLVSYATRACEVTVSPARGCRHPWNSCSPTARRASTRRSSIGRRFDHASITDERLVAATSGGAYAATMKPSASADIGSAVSGNVLRIRRPSSRGVSPGRRSAPASLASTSVRFQ